MTGAERCGRRVPRRSDLAIVHSVIKCHRGNALVLTCGLGPSEHIRRKPTKMSSAFFPIATTAPLQTPLTRAAPH